jgi:hypothetical protein
VNEWPVSTVDFSSWNGSEVSEIALKARDPILERNRGIARSNGKLLNDFFADFQDRYEWREPDSNCYIVSG